VTSLDAALADLAPRGSHVLFAHAHPDDETLATGALISALTRRGVKVSVTTATRGERGGVVPGPLSALAGTPELEAHRQTELAGALAVLGTEPPCYLGEPPARADGLAPRRYQDSGMVWVTPTQAGPAPDAGPASLTAAPAAEVAADLSALIGVLAPDLLISYDAAGGYGHPDHVFMHHAAKAAAAATGVPFAEVISIPRDERAPAGDGAVWLDLHDEQPTLVEALRHHASQLTVVDDHVVHSGGQHEALQLVIGLRRIG
jgi:N-acetyl-1-D-myo-inositol-2-amino-2-deoxy-alpha-D-glucopyranoside deacetylase